VAPTADGFHRTAFWEPVAMGLSILTADAAFAFRRGPDWAAARRAIEDLDAEGVDILWFDLWSDDSGEVDVEGLRTHLVGDLELFVGAFGAGPSSGLDVIYTAQHCYLVTGGAISGGEPTSLCDPLWNLGTAGILRAAGSVVWTTMGDIDFAPPTDGPDRPWNPPVASRYSFGLTWFVAGAPPDWESALRIAGSALEADVSRLREEMEGFLREQTLGLSPVVTTTRVGESTVWLFGRLGGSDDLADCVDRLRAAGVLEAAGVA
jgi:hypothetical protein